MKRQVLILLAFLFLNVFARSQTEKDSTKKVNYAAIPIVNYSPSFGFAFGAMANVFYKINSNDTISPTSSTGVLGVYTTNKTYFFAAFQKFYFNRDRWRVSLIGGIGNLNFQYWQELPIIGGQFVDFSTEASFAMVKVERKIYQKLYGGIHATYAQTTTKFDVPDYFPDSLKTDVRNMNSMGYLFNYDRRDHQINPYGGFNISLKASYYRTWMNSGNDFSNYELVYNHFYQIKNERHILVTRFKAEISAGDVPFQGQNIVGGDDIRGYSSGKYRDDQIYSIQAEYRWRFYKKMGMVGFMGVASAVDAFGDISLNELLPAAGVGLRYLMIPKERVNIGVDVAAGKNDWGLYFRIGESFGR